MKKSYIILIGILFFLSCKKDDNPVFRVLFNPVTITVDPTMSAFEEHSFLARVRTNFQNSFDAAGVNPDSIKYIRPFNASLTKIFNGNLNFIRATSIRLCPLGASNANRCGTEAFWRDPVPNNVNSRIDYANGGVNDIRDLVLNEEIELQIILEELWTPPGEIFDIQVLVEFGVW